MDSIIIIDDEAQIKLISPPDLNNYTYKFPVEAKNAKCKVVKVGNEMKFYLWDKTKPDNILKVPVISNNFTIITNDFPSEDWIEFGK